MRREPSGFAKVSRTVLVLWAAGTRLSLRARPGASLKVRLGPGGSSPKVCVCFVADVRMQFLRPLGITAHAAAE